MNIGQVSHVYPPHIGGVENYVCRLKHSLIEMGNKVTVYTTDLGMPHNYIIQETNVNYCKVNLSLFRNPVSLELAQKLKKNEEDIFHLHGYEFFSTFLATRILRDKPKVLTQHGNQQLNNDLIGFLLNYPCHPFIKHILDNMDKIIVYGERDKLFLQDQYSISSQKITIIPNGINISKFDSLQICDDNFIKRYHLKKNSFKILFVGRLVEQKGAHKLVNAVKEFMHDDNFEVLIIGNGDSKYVEQLIKINDPRVHFLGEINFDDLIAAYSISNLFVILSQFEGLPTVMLEAMACGLPVLATPVGNIPEVIIEGKNGFFIDSPIDEKDLAGKLEYLINADNLKIGENNMKLIRERFNWEIISEKIFNIYKDVLDHY